MTLRFEVEMPKTGVRFHPDYEKKIKDHEYSFTALATKTLAGNVNVRGFTDNEKDHAKLIIKYEEDFDPESSFASFFKRAEDYARAYCKQIGLGAD